MKEVLAGAGVWGQRDTPLRTLSDLWILMCKYFLEFLFSIILG